jgi:hypothetical protein
VHHPRKAHRPSERPIPPPRPCRAGPRAYFGWRSGPLTSIFPALDRALEDLIGAGPLVLLTGFQTAAAITLAA